MTILSNTTTVGTSAMINDNGSWCRHLGQKRCTGTLDSRNNTTNNSYSGGTYVVEGTLTTGTTANRAYLGSGKVTVNNAILTLGNIGATSNATGDDYTAINGGADQHRQWSRWCLYRWRQIQHRGQQRHRGRLGFGPKPRQPHPWHQHHPRIGCDHWS